MFEALRARLEQLLADHTPPQDPRARTVALHAALLVHEVALGSMRDALATAERKLAAERSQLDDAERRHVVAILRRTGGNKRAACRILGISRPRLDRIIARHRIEVTERGQGGNGV